MPFSRKKIIYVQFPNHQFESSRLPKANKNFKSSQKKKFKTLYPQFDIKVDHGGRSVPWV